MMKIEDAHYQEIVKALTAIKGWLDMASAQYEAQGHSTQRFMWDGFRVAKVQGNTTQWVCKELYQYMNDEHINTALRAAYAQIGVLHKAGSEMVWNPPQAPQSSENLGLPAPPCDDSRDESQMESRFSG